MSRWMNALLGFFLPSMCLSCQCVIATPGCCPICTVHLPWLSNSCRRCAKPIAAAGLCGPCYFKPPAFYQTVSPFCYAAPIDRWLVGLKFYEQLTVAPFLAECLWKKCCVTYQQQAWPQLLIPVPLHSARLRQRGFNQALVIARYVAKLSHLPLSRYSVIKHRLTSPQTTLSKNARRRNLKNAFSVTKNLNVSHVALIDDVYTTGATAQAVASLLLKHGVKRVDVWCVARTL